MRCCSVEGWKVHLWLTGHFALAQVCSIHLFSSEVQRPLGFERQVCLVNQVHNKIFHVLDTRMEFHAIYQNGLYLVNLFTLIFRLLVGDLNISIGTETSCHEFQDSSGGSSSGTSTTWILCVCFLCLLVVEPLLEVVYSPIDSVLL